MICLPIERESPGTLLLPPEGALKVMRWHWDGECCCYFVVFAFVRVEIMLSIAAADEFVSDLIVISMLTLPKSLTAASRRCIGGQPTILGW